MLTPLLISYSRMANNDLTCIPRMLNLSQIDSISNIQWHNEQKGRTIRILITVARKYSAFTFSFVKMLMCDPLFCR